jgi:serine/threonine protein kinase
MTSPQLDEEAIFHIARSIPDLSVRGAYLDQICAGDLVLRERVEALLQVHEQDRSFLKLAEPASTVAQAAVAERPGSTIDRYKLMEQVGEGGMGIVFVAQQDRPIRRKVALKVIKPGMDSKAVVARFEAERQALAMMDHPNIAKVLDAGTAESGRPYFVMELVRGVPITEYCDRNKLAIRDRLALFVQVCQAIQHAHQKGIIHRDIKPSNVLVTLHDGKPVPKVIDFGVAKALNARLTDRTIYTEHLQIVGTLLYMSPEQAELSGLDVDTRSDIYSLGVLLYELLTGQTPFESKRLHEAAWQEACRIIREEDPPKPSVRISSLGGTLTVISGHRQTDPRTLPRLVRGDLDWIVMKALEKDRTRRYEAASALAADVQRFQDQEPIAARPPSAIYRLRKSARRHRVAVAMSLVTGVAILSAVLGLALVQVANASRRQALSRFRQLFLDHGFTLIMTAQPEKAKELIGELEDVNLDEYAAKLRAVQFLHESHFQEAIALLEPAVEQHPEDAGYRAMLSDAYDQAGRIDEFIRSHAKLKTLNTDGLHSVELVYAAFANIVEPKRGYDLACRAVQENPASPYARLVRGRMAANWVQRSTPFKLSLKAN